LVRGHKTPLQNNAPIEPFRQALQDCSGHRFVEIDLPETRRTAAKSCFIAVMERPHAVPRGLQNVATDYPERKPQDEIQIECADESHILRPEVLGELALAYDRAGDARHTRK